MKKSRKVSNRRPGARRGRAFRAGLFACALLFAGVTAAVATYASRDAARPDAQPASASAPGGNFVTVEVGGKRLRVNAQTLQQGPLAQADEQQIVEQLEGNKATEGLVQVKHEDGTVEVDLQGRFQNVTMARRNDDGTVSAACVDTPEAASAFIRNTRTAEAGNETGTGTGTIKKAARE